MCYYNMYYYSLLVATLVLCLALHGADTASVRIFSNTDDETVAAVGTTLMLCAQNTGLTYLTNSTTTCLRQVDYLGDSNYTGCPAEVSGSREIFCLSYGPVCFVTNNVTKSVVAFNSTSESSIVATYGSSYFTLVDPSYITGYTISNSSIADMFITDFDGSNIIVYHLQFDMIYLVAAAALVVKIPSAQPAAGIFATTSSFTIAALQDTSLRSYNYTGGLMKKTRFTNTTFGNIQSLSTDALGNVFVVDASCSCLIKLPASGTQTTNYSLSYPVISIAHSRDAHFIVDTMGVLKISNDLVITSYNYTNITCLYGTVSVSVSGGVAPYYYYINPRFSTITTSSLTTNTWTNVKSFKPYSNMTLYSDGNLISQFYDETVYNVQNPLSTDIPSHSGGLYTYSMTMVAGGDSHWRCQSCMNAVYFYGIEFWLNVGQGGQSFSVRAYGLTDVRYYYPNDLPLNKWVRFFFDFRKLPIMAPADLVIHGLANSSNPVYLDDIKLLPYDSTYPTAIVSDSCNVFVSTPVMPVQQNIFTVTVNTPSTTCSAGSTDGSLASDAIMVANVTGGVPPYTYSWSFSNSTTNTATDLPKTHASIIVYDNAVNASWQDISPTAYGIPQDPTFYRSPPYSYSFASGSYYDGLYFNFPRGMNAYDYAAFEFYIYGGSFGGQYLGAGVGDGLNQESTFYTLSYLMNCPFVGPNEWIKVTLPIPPATGTSPLFTGLVIVGFSDIPQRRVWIDDVTLLSSKNVTVMDSQHCKVSNYYIEVTSPPLITATATKKPIKCYGGSEGAVTFNVSGGTAPYTYDWSLADISNTSSSISDLPQSVVTAVVTDANGCHAPQGFTVTVDQPPQIDVTSQLTHPICYGGTGTIIATALGGTGPYTYRWQTSSSSSVFNITNQPNTFPIFTDALANGFTTNGSPNTTLACGSVGPYTLPAGVHYTHAGYCSLAVMPTTNATIANRTAPTTVAMLGCPSCIDLTLYSGIEMWIAVDPTLLPFMSLWLLSEGESIAAPLYFNAIANLTTTGDPIWQQVNFPFDILVNDTVADTIWLQSSVPVPVALLDDIVLIPLASSSATTSMGINVNVGFNSIVAANAGKYTLSVTDKNSCPTIRTFTVNQPTKMVVSPSISSSGAGTLDVVGGVPPYTYLWVELNVTAQEVQSIPPGVYTIQVTDAIGCVSTASLFLQNNNVLTLRSFNPSISIGLGVIVGFGVLIVLFSVFMLVKYWVSFSVLGSFFCCVLLFGVSMSYVAALTLLPRPTDTLCTAFPWFLGIAFILVYGCLFIKTWALYQVWSKAKQYQKTNLTPFYIIRILGLAVLVEVIFLIIWTVIDPPRVQRIKVVSSQYELQCNTNHPTFWVIFLSVKGIWLVFGAILSVLTRDVVKKYNESTSISYAIYNIIVLCAIGIPLGVLLEEVPGGRLVIEVVITVLAFTFTMVLMFFKSWYAALNVDATTYPSRASHSSTHSSSGSPGNTIMHVPSSPNMSSTRRHLPNDIVAI